MPIKRVEIGREAVLFTTFLSRSATMIEKGISMD